MERDWLQVVTEETCDECGLAAASVPLAELGTRHRDAAARWSALLVGTPVDDLRHRPTPEMWSALEYGCHVRDVLAEFTSRAQLALDEDHPRWGWWDHEASAIDERYDEQDPIDVAGALVRNAERFASLLDGLDDAQVARTGERRDGEVFTVERLGRFALHEAEHHLVDARR